MSKHLIGLMTLSVGLAPMALGAWPLRSGQVSDPKPRFVATAAPARSADPSFGLDGPIGPSPEVPRGGPQTAVGSEAPGGNKDEVVEPKPPTRQQSLDSLFGRLAKASDPDEATGIASLIERIWMRSGSDTADLLMTRAVLAMNNNRRDLARALLDKIVLLRPDWAEAWNKRATLRFLDDDDSGSMEDIGHVLTLEPRHFGALSGLGFILKRNGLEKQALKALRRAGEIYPENTDIRKAVDELVPEVEGRDL